MELYQKDKVAYFKVGPTDKMLVEQHVKKKDDYNFICINPLIYTKLKIAKAKKKKNLFHNFK